MTRRDYVTRSFVIDVTSARARTVMRGPFAWFYLLSSLAKLEENTKMLFGSSTEDIAQLSGCSRSLGTQKYRSSQEVRRHLRRGQTAPSRSADSARVTPLLFVGVARARIASAPTKKERLAGAGVYPLGAFRPRLRYLRTSWLDPNDKRRRGATVASTGSAQTPAAFRRAAAPSRLLGGWWVRPGCRQYGPAPCPRCPNR